MANCLKKPEPLVSRQIAISVSSPDPYARCPHAREVIERLLAKIEIEPYQSELMRGAKSAEEHLARRKAELREEFIRRLLKIECKALERAWRQGYRTLDEIAKDFPYTPLPLSK
ncbi:MAG: hypothetical protein HYT34_01000 [Candidatus Ryanbacteria bacterium]|nr:hypothetical protein [Candidatus Ryanbacteria bacterium]